MFADFPALLRFKEIAQEDVPSTFFLEIPPVMAKSDNVCVTNQIGQLNDSIRAIQ